jgi:restriction system protein
VAAIQGLIDDLLEFGLRLRPRVGIALAVLSWMIFHVIAGQTVPVAGKAAAAGIAAFTLQTLIYFTALFLQFAFPFCLMVGVLVSVIRRRRAKQIMARSRDNPKTAIAGMTWQQFEQFVGESLRKQGFSVLEMGGNRPDGGVDLVLEKHGRRYLVQCKHWKTWQVGVAVVRELNGVIAEQKADGGYVITGGHFTRVAEVFARSCGIKLIDGITLERMLKSIAYAPDGSVAQATNGPTECPSCPKCEAPMEQKLAQQGQFKGQPFWSCTTFPKCRGILHIESVA